MKILVTGCAGFIGSHLCESLLRNDFQVIGIDNFDPFYPKKIKENNLSQFINHKNFTFHEFDLCNKDSYENINDENINIVVHLAAKAGVRPSLLHPQDYIQNNISASQNILNFIIDNDIKNYVFASSSSIYGNSKTIPFNESDPCNKPISPYAYTKKSCEMMNYSYHALYNINIINLRFFTVFGPRQRPDLAIHKFVDKIVNNKPIEMYGDGSSARDYTYISDIIEGINSSINYLANNESVFESINLGNHYPVQLSKLIDIIADKLGIQPEIIQQNQKPGEVDITYADISKAQKILNYNPKTAFEDGIENFIKWYKEKNG